MDAILNNLTYSGVPLLFCISGFYAYFSLKKKGEKREVYMKFLRLGFIFLIISIYVIFLDEFLAMVKMLNKG